MTAVGTGEMNTWSDLAAGAPGGGVLAAVVDAVVSEGATVVVVGAHDLELLEQVEARAASVTVVVRSILDAERIGVHFAGRVSVRAGDVLAADVEPADVVLALGDLTSTVSLEAQPPTWRAVFERVVAFGRPGARLAVLVENPLSLAVLAAVPSRGADDRDGAWRPATLDDDTRPATRAAVAALVAGGGARAVFGAAATRPAMVVARTEDVPEAWVVAATPTGGAFDRRVAMSVAARIGRLDDLAPGWLLLRGAAGLADVVGSDASGETSAWGDERPRGRLLESVLLEACRDRDATGVRDLARRFADTALDEEWGPLGLTDVVVTTDGGIAVSAPPMASGDGARTAAGWFGAFAVRLFALGWRHPWPVTFGPLQVARALAAMADLDPELVGPVAAPSPAPMDPSAWQRIEEGLRARISWFEEMLRVRQDEVVALRRNNAARVPALERELAALRSSTSLKVGQAVVRPLSRAKEAAAAALERRVRR